MLSRWGELDQSWTMMDEMRRRMDRVFRDASGGGTAGWPRTALWDAGASLMLTAEVPGMTEKDVRLTVNQNVLALEGDRRIEAPQGYAVHRRERAPAKFARSFELPCAVDLERTTATVKDGVLTVTLPKAPEARPRQIAVRTQ